MPVVTNLRKWKNGEVFNARDYVYEREAIVTQLNRLTLLLEGNQEGDGINIAVDQISVGDLKINVNDRTGLLQADMDSVKLQFGQQIFFYVKFLEGVNKGDAIQFAGAQGSHFLAKKAVQSEINANPEYFLGLAANTYSESFFGLVLEFGPLPSIFRQAFPSGSILWYDSVGTTPGALTLTEPPRTKARIRVAAVINDQNSNLGEWIVRPSILEVDGIQTFLNSNEPQYPIEGDLWFEQST
jgi:hypothetical protein